jgi:hypothetical protein
MSADRVITPRRVLNQQRHVISVISHLLDRTAICGASRCYDTKLVGWEGDNLTKCTLGASEVSKATTWAWKWSRLVPYLQFIYWLVASGNQHMVSTDMESFLHVFNGLYSLTFY